jgi:tRNA dimethylallyltransferase
VAVRAGDQGQDQTQSKLPIIVIAGPTASGKSALALALAAAYGGTIINGDALQIYRDLRILTARPDAAAEAAARHRLYGVLDAAERGSVGRWRDLAEAEIASAHAAGRLPIVVGGTGLYLRALLTGLAEVPDVPAGVRDEAIALHRALGGTEFRRRLAEHDPAAAARLNEGDTQRLIRAFEVVRATGAPLAAWQARAAAVSRVSAATILLMPPRPALYAACDARFAAMIAHGGFDEAAALAARNLSPDLPAMKAVGVPELLRHLRGELSREGAIVAGQQSTRRYAKRQTTWFRHQLDAGLILDAQFSESLLQCSCHFIDGFLLTHRR